MFVAAILLVSITSTNLVFGNTCKDDYDDCSGWAARGDCDKNPGFMIPSCAESCHQCEQGDQPRETLQKLGLVGDACKDEYDDCTGWAERGDCDSNPGFMTTYCRISCHQCEQSDQPAEEAKEPEITECKDENENCKHWASRDQCYSNPSYMLKSCPDSCHQCSCGDNDITCAAWARSGECTKNPDYMDIHCRESCKLCSSGISVNEKEDQEEHSQNLGTKDISAENEKKSSQEDVKEEPESKSEENTASESIEESKHEKKEKIKIGNSISSLIGNLL